jgi:molecular chaperone DnaK
VTSVPDCPPGHAIVQEIALSLPFRESDASRRPGTQVRRGTIDGDDARPNVIGIDLGTMFSAVAAADGPGPARVLPDRYGRRLTPSVVGWDGTRMLVGGRRAMPAEAVVQFVRSAAGDPSWRFPLAGRSLRVEEVAAVLLAGLREDAERALGRPVTDAVLTVPACFGAVARQSLLHAARIACLPVRTVGEPTAAVLGCRDRLPGGGTVLVFGLGGGAVDVSVLARHGDEVTVLATRGDPELGGWDWDNALLKLVHDRLRADGGENLLDGGDAEARLREEVVRAKRTLSRADRAEVGPSVTVTRAEFEQAVAALLGRTRRLVEAVLAAAGLGAREVDDVLLAGGPTRMPMVRRMLREMFGRLPPVHASPQELAALGAAELARPEGERPRVTEVASYGLGALATDAVTGRPRNVVVLRAGSVLPAAGTELFSPVAAGQRQIVVEVTQGDGSAPAEVRRLNRRPVGLPPGVSGGVELCLRYDLDQRPWLGVRHRPSGVSLDELEVLGAGAMTPQDIARSAGLLRELAGQRSLADPPSTTTR